jgi:hypothetical protein
MEGFSLPEIWARYGKWGKAAVPVVLGLIVLLVVYGTWVGYAVRVESDPSLPIQVKKDKRGEKVVLKVTVKNEGEDVPDLSLRSIAVAVDFLYRDGRREKKTAFPRSEHRGEGALLRGESGGFEIEAPAKGLREVVLRSEIIDLGMGRTLVPPGGAWRHVPKAR